MFETGKARLRLVASGNMFSLKIAPLFFCAALAIGNTTVTHADDEIKIPGLWAAVKDFWYFLSTADDTEQSLIAVEEVQDNNKQLVEIISDELSTSDGADDLGLVELSNNPVCKAIYVAEYLPSYNQQAIEKCKKLIEQEEYKILFEHYVSELCRQTSGSTLSQDQIVQIQLRLRKYSQTFPQANFRVDLKDIDGIYGSKTCQHIAFYQIASQSEIVDGQPDQWLYDQLANIVPMSETEIENSMNAVQKSRKFSARNRPDPILADQDRNSLNRALPVDPMQKDVFCTRHSSDPHCKEAVEDSGFINLVISER